MIYKLVEENDKAIMLYMKTKILQGKSPWNNAYNKKCKVN